MPDDIYAGFATSLGHVIIAFNELEVALGGALMRILKQDDFVGAVFVSVLGFQQKCQLLSALSSKIENEAHRAEFNEMLVLANDVNILRNRFVHAEYTPVFDDNDEIAAVLHRRLKDFRKNTFTSVRELFKLVGPLDDGELVELANDASSLAMEILNLSEKF